MGFVLDRKMKMIGYETKVQDSNLSVGQWEDFRKTNVQNSGSNIIKSSNTQVIVLT